MLRKILFLGVFIFIGSTTQAYAQLRIVRVGVIVDRGGDQASLSGSIDAALKAVDFSSKVLEQRFKIKLTLAGLNYRDLWRGKKELNSNIIHDNGIDGVNRIGLNNADIVLVYTRKPILRYASEDIDGETTFVFKPTYGIAFVLGRVTLITLNSYVSLTTLHEIYHLFGAIDLIRRDEKSIMYSLEDGESLDQKNSEIILKNRSRIFR